jgi:UDP-glucose 4-epimerase
MRAFVTGAAGFIGSNLCDRLLARGDEVVGYDDFSTGNRRFLTDALGSARFRLVEGDILDPRALALTMSGSDAVFHLAANADVRQGVDRPERDLEQNTLGTARVLGAMRATGVKRIAFASTGSVYGEPSVFPTPEDAPFPVQTSFYAASKLAGEALISAHCEGYGFTGWIFRFVSILGERYTHGHVFDFYRALRADPTRLRILGDGKQRKSYLYVGDCVSAILTALEDASPGARIFNLGRRDFVEVDGSAAIIARELGARPEREYAGGTRGWVGDSPFILLDTSRMEALGWRPTVTIEEGVCRTVAWLRANEWVYDARP